MTPRKSTLSIRPVIFWPTFSARTLVKYFTRCLLTVMGSIPDLVWPLLLVSNNDIGPKAAFCYAALPQISPQLMPYPLYRWENNIRAAVVLDVVGTGGLGQMLKYHLSLFQIQQAASVILAMMLMITVVDGGSF